MRKRNFSDCELLFDRAMMYGMGGVIPMSILRYDTAATGLRNFFIDVSPIGAHEVMYGKRKEHLKKLKADHEAKQGTVEKNFPQEEVEGSKEH